MKRKAFIIGLAALALSLGSIGIIGGVSLGFDDSLIATKAVASTTGDTLEFSSKCGGSGTSTNGVTWKVTSDVSSESSGDLEKGLHYGTGGTNGKKLSFLTLTSDPYEKEISKIVVKASNGSSKTPAIVNVTVGDKQFGEDVDLPVSATNKECSFSGKASGIVVVKISKELSVDALYLKSITIKFATGESSISFVGDSDVTIKNGDSKDVTIKTDNLPNGGTISVATEDSEIATAVISGNVVTINGCGIGSTKYVVSMKNGAGEQIASCSGNITVSSTLTSIAVSSDFADGATLRIGTTHKINVTSTPADASNKVTWTLSDDEAASISEDGTLSILKKVNAKPVTLMAASVLDSTLTSSISFYIDNVFEASELVSEDGLTAPNGLVVGESQVVTHGTVTAIDGTSIYIQSGSSALEIETVGKAFAEVAVGDGVQVSGKYKIENGVTKLTSPKLIEKGDAYKESVTSLELTSADMVSKNTNRFVSAASTLATYSSSLSDKAVSISFTLNDEDKTPYSLYISSDYAPKALSQFGDVESGIAYDINGIYSFYNNKTQRIVFVDGCSYYNTALTDFIATYIAPYSGDAKEGETCASKYANASAALGKLTEASQNTFKTALAYEEAYSVYSYWESHQTSANGAKLIAGHQTTDWANIAVIASITLIAAGASVYLIRNRKKQDR